MQAEKHFAHVGYILDILRSNGDQRLYAETLPQILREQYHVDATKAEVDDALALISPLIALTKRGLRLSPLATTESRSSFYSSRVRLNPAPKRSVAMHIYREILEELDSIFLDAGSANGAVAEEMAYGEKKNFTVLTNNVRAVRTFLANATIRTFVTGGIYDVEDEALVGDRALFDWKRYGTKTALVGVSAISTHYVYNHALTGEERIKAHYWRIPADHLVVPATLGKFKGQDASCFGRLFREQDGKADAAVSDSQNSGNIDVIGKAAHDQWREGPLVEYDAQGFKAKKCTIVIEPKWMIEALYRQDPDLQAELMAAVDQIKGERTRSKVDIVHAAITEDEFFCEYPTFREYFSHDKVQVAYAGSGFPA